MRQANWRIFNELGGADNCACNIVNYFLCPHMDGRDRLLEDGYDVYHLWAHVEWYDRHWNPNHTWTPAASELKWFHFNEPPIIDVTNYDDIIQAITDGRLDKIIDEHTRYMKENDREIWAV